MSIITGHFAKVSANPWVNAKLPVLAWQATTAFSVGNSVAVSGGRVFVCTTPGITAGSAPTWPTTPQGVQVTDGIHVVWQLANLLPSAAALFDQIASQAVNGDDGSCHAPTTPVSFIGSTFGLKCSVATVIWGSGAYLETSGSSRFISTGTTFPLLAPGHVGQTRNIKSSFLTARGLPWAQLQPHREASGNLDGMVQTVARSTQAYNALLPTATGIIAPVEVHNGSTIASVTITFAVVSQPATVPAVMPRARLVRIDTSGNVYIMTSQAAGATSDGHVSFPAPASAAAYYAGGAVQPWVIPVDMNNVVDTSQYTYEVQIVEEQTGVITPILQPVDLVTNATFQPGGPTTSVPATIDGVAPAVGMRVLFKDQPMPEQNGIYVLNPNGSGTPGAFGVTTRASDMAVGASLAAGTQIPVKAGGAFLGSSLFTLAQAATVGSTNYGSWPTSPIAVPLGTVVAPSNVVGLQMPNGFLYVCTTAGTTASTPPTWPVTAGATVVDGSVTWTAFADPSSPLYFETMGKTTPTLPPIWLPSHGYSMGATVSPSVPNGFIFIALASGTLTSGSSEPSWNAGPGLSTSDGGGGFVWWAFAIPGFKPATPAGNIWNDLTVECTNITSLDFQ